MKNKPNFRVVCHWVPHQGAIYETQIQSHTTGKWVAIGIHFTYLDLVRAGFGGDKMVSCKHSSNDTSYPLIRCRG